MDDAKVTCTSCGFDWFGSTAAHALRTVGSCTRCRGDLVFHEEAAAEPFYAVRDVPAHLALGDPRR